MAEMASSRGCERLELMFSSDPAAPPAHAAPPEASVLKRSPRWCVGKALGGHAGTQSLAHTWDVKQHPKGRSGDNMRQHRSGDGCASCDPDPVPFWFGIVWDPPSRSVDRSEKGFLRQTIEPPDPDRPKTDNSEDAPWYHHGRGTWPLGI